MKFVFSILLWLVPVLVLAFLAGRARAALVRNILRVIYLPVFLFVMLAAFWLWAGDGATNLIAVPALFAVFVFVSVRYVLGILKQRLAPFEALFLSLGLAVGLTLLGLAFLYAVLPWSLVIS